MKRITMRGQTRMHFWNGKERHGAPGAFLHKQKKVENVGTSRKQVNVPLSEKRAHWIAIRPKQVRPQVLFFHSSFRHILFGESFVYYLLIFTKPKREEVSPTPSPAALIPALLPQRRRSHELPPQHPITPRKYEPGCRSCK